MLISSSHLSTTDYFTTDFFIISGTSVAHWLIFKFLKFCFGCKNSSINDKKKEKEVIFVVGSFYF